MRRGAPEPEPRPKWWSRAERQRLREAWTDAEVQKIAATGNAQANLITAAGRARLHADRAQYTEALTLGVAEEFKAMHHGIAQIAADAPQDQVLARALAEIEYTGFTVLKSHLHDHERDGRTWLG
jgi:hypothetical protein